MPEFIFSGTAESIIFSYFPNCSIAAVSLQRQALSQAIHHAQYRKAFGARLIDQPLMRNVLADLSLEYEANLSMVFRVARAYDEKDDGFARLAVAIAKYWTNKRTGYFVNEAMECLGGAGYVEESILPRLYREAPLNGIWEGSGNVICLDILRTIRKEPEALHSLFAEIEKGRGVDSLLDRAIENVKDAISHSEDMIFQARYLVEQLAMVFQGSLLAQYGAPDIFDAFVQTRIFRSGGMAYGTFPKRLGTETILNRMKPKV